MIDLTKKDIEYLNNLIIKYEKILVDLKYIELYPIYAYVLESTTQYLKNLTTINIEWKQWASIALIKLVEKDQINSDQDIISNIDKFIKYYNENYKKYLSELGHMTSKFDTDIGFVYRFIDNYKFPN